MKIMKEKILVGECLLLLLLLTGCQPTGPWWVEMSCQYDNQTLDDDKYKGWQLDIPSIPFEIMEDGIFEGKGKIYATKITAGGKACLEGNVDLIGHRIEGGLDFDKLGIGLDSAARSDCYNPGDKVSLILVIDLAAGWWINEKLEDADQEAGKKIEPDIIAKDGAESVIIASPCFWHVVLHRGQYTPSPIP